VAHGVALRYVLPVLSMTSRLAVMGATPKRGGCTMQRLPWAAWRYRGGVWCLWMLVRRSIYIPHYKAKNTEIFFVISSTKSCQLWQYLVH